MKLSELEEGTIGLLDNELIVCSSIKSLFDDRVVICVIGEKLDDGSFYFYSIPMDTKHLFPDTEVVKLKLMEG